jgi:hypothetical protein
MIELHWSTQSEIREGNLGSVASMLEDICLAINSLEEQVRDIEERLSKIEEKQEDKSDG